MFPIDWKKFVHPAGVYRLEYPAHWDQVQKDEARSCGFGPHDRDDVGLWISLMPVSVDTDRLAEELPKILEPGDPADGGGQRPPRSDPAPLRRQGRCAQGGRRRPLLADRRRRRGALRQQPASRRRSATSGTRPSSA